MKKISFILLFALMLTGLFNACKKGKDDPFLSLKSRNARLKGTWVLTSAQSSSTLGRLNNDGDESATFDGANMTLVSENMDIDFSGNTSVWTSTETFPYTYELTIEKHSRFNSTKTTVTSGNTHTLNASGEWQWVDGNKNKVFLSLPGESPDMISEENVYYIERLSNKKLVLTVDHEQGNVTTHIRLEFKKK